MSEKVDTTIALLTQFGVTEPEATIYLEILSGRGDTALALARSVKLARTKVYRLLDNLIAKGLVITRLGERGTRFSALPPNQLEILLSDREHELARLRQTLPTLESQLVEISNLKQDSKAPQVLYYHGIEGLKQVTYNSLRAKGELLSYELETMNSFLSRGWAEDFRKKFVANKIHIRTMVNSTKMAGWTDVTEMVKNYWEMRHVSLVGKPFQFEILIYNDVYCMYRYTGEDIFCVEIHSAELADMQRQLFEIIWSNAKKFKVLDDHGAATLA
jgi:hypothetical protein